MTNPSLEAPAGQQCSGISPPVSVPLRCPALEAPGPRITHISGRQITSEGSAPLATSPSPLPGLEMLYGAEFGNLHSGPSSVQLASGS